MGHNTYIAVGVPVPGDTTIVYMTTFCVGKLYGSPVDLLRERVQADPSREGYILGPDGNYEHREDACGQRVSEATVDEVVKALRETADTPAYARSERRCELIAEMIKDLQDTRSQRHTCYMWRD